jgi:hypothetical protein
MNKQDSSDKRVDLPVKAFVIVWGQGDGTDGVTNGGEGVKRVYFWFFIRLFMRMGFGGVHGIFFIRFCVMNDFWLFLTLFITGSFLYSSISFLFFSFLIPSVFCACHNYIPSCEEDE